MNGKMKRIASILLVCTMVLSMGFLSGCGAEKGVGSPDAVNTEPPSASASATATEAVTEPKLDPVTLTWYVYRDNTEPDDQMVFDKANEILKEKLNVTLKMESLSYAEYPEKLQLLVSAGDKFDLCFTAGWLFTYSTQATKGAFEPLDDLITQYAPETKKLIPELIWGDTKVKDADGKDKIFGVPNYQISYTQYGIAFKKDIVDKYNLADQILAVKKQSDLTPIFDIVKKGEPKLNIVKDGPWWVKEMTGDGIVASLEDGWFVAAGEDHKVKDLSDESFFKLWLDDTALANEWYKKGFFHKDYGISEDLYPEVKAGKFFAWNEKYKPGVEADVKRNVGFDVMVIPIGDKILSGVQDTLTAINRNSENKERAMMLIELMNTDKELYNLMVYGIEGTHYKKVGENRIEPIPDAKYKNNAWELGCQFNAYLLPGQVDDVWEVTKKGNAEAKKPPMHGFTFDKNNLKTEQANITALTKENKAIFYGLIDNYEAKLLELRDKLVKAGMTKYKEEAQRQIDEYYAK
jgi:putative aldouronate transport system substrate-binding protein